ncbi:penicillin-binding protein PBP2A [Streptococcus loxodontisalivarius]|uniref:Penicillin-binding protein 2A n=1 Tax=Streptococcus loxodontisalivarius TaxID=1349415 RepID=A0ABS2PQI2_9STRE|nr:penicillin-binding protein PBP2A [Streptococcus loxodontisalivarius]MBM7642303.1 penicillin-binding protein 2A [Streptococcus loxodontisalivarius]
MKWIEKLKEQTGAWKQKLSQKLSSKEKQKKKEGLEEVDQPKTDELQESASKEERPSSQYQRSKVKETWSDKFFAKFPQLVWMRKLVPSKKSWIRRFWRRYHVGKILLLLMGVGVLAIGSYLFYVAKSTNVSDLQDALKATTIIYDKDQQQVGSLSGQKGTYVELDAISDNMKNAVVATEDRTFYENNGINLSRFLLATFTMGRFGGGSTITQQLAKNAYLTQEQTITRKAKEFFLALELTKKYSKDDILTMYLNNAYFGNSVWGIEDASKKYFGVSAAELTLDEAATLAGMLKGPEIYNPIYSVENATNRRNTVLQAMVDAGKISENEAKSASEVDMSSRLNDAYTGTSDDYQYASYFDAVIQEAEQTYGISEDDIVNNGYKIYTELDQNFQSNMQSLFDNGAYFPTSDYDGESAQAASVAMDPKTGAVWGLVGRVGSTSATFRSYNYATQAARSPGSTIKPLVVYTPAIVSGYAINTELPNTVQDYDGYAPTNYAGIESESVPMYQALANSYNIPAVYLLNEMGVNKAFTYGEKFGLNMDKANKELGVALGGSVTTNPLEMAQAYATFANGGVMPTAHLITKIETASGETVAEFKQSETRVMSESAANKMTSMMLGTFSNGSAINANAYGYTLAGKTGTVETSFNADLTSDQWVIGYTPDVVISQWLGYDSTDENHYLTDASSGTASTLFSDVASAVLPYTAGTSFTVENAYSQNGIALTYNTGSSQSETSDSSSSDVWSNIQDSAQSAGDSIGQALNDAGNAVKDAWNNVSNWFSSQIN